MMIKQAVDAMLSGGHISEEEYQALEEFHVFEENGLEKASEEIEKCSGFGAAAKLLAHGTGKKLTSAIKNWGLPLGAGLTGVAIFKESIVDPVMDASKMKRSFGAIREKVPALAEKDQDQMRDYFNVIKTFSPKSASNPLVAGALVNKMMEFGGVDHKLVQDISAIEQGLQRTRVGQTFAENAAKAVAGASLKESV